MVRILLIVSGLIDAFSSSDYFRIALSEALTLARCGTDSLFEHLLKQHDSAGSSTCFSVPPSAAFAICQAQCARRNPSAGDEHADQIFRCLLDGFGSPGGGNLRRAGIREG